MYKAIGCIVTSALFFALMNMFVSLSGEVPTVQKTFFRNFFALIIASGVMIRNRCSVVPPKGARVDLVMRAAFGFAGMLGNFYALSRLTVSDASMLNKMSPFFAIVFSAIVLKERADKVQWSLVAAAFLGAMLVIKPSFHNAELIASCAGFFGGVCAGAAYTFVRRITQKGVKGYYVVFFFSAFSTLAALPFVVFGYSPMSAEQWAYLIAAGICAAVGQFTITAAYSFAPAREVSVYDYSQIIFAALLGFFVMGQIPDVLSVAGYAVIIAAAVVMFKYNNRGSGAPEKGKNNFKAE